MPHVQVLVGEVQRPRWILLDDPVQRLDAFTALAIASIFQELETCATEAILLLEDGFIRNCDFDSGVRAAVEA